MKILLVRHADAEPLKEGISDAERTLTTKGHEQLMRRVSEIRSYFSMQGRVALWSSDYVRAVETARYFEESMSGVSLETYKFLRKNRVDRLRSHLKKCEADTVLIVGHNPMLEDWIEELSGERIHLRKMEAICMETDGDQGVILWEWAQDGRVLVRLFSPEMHLRAQQWLEECAFAVHVDIVLSRFALQRGESDAETDRHTLLMAAFLRLLAPILPEKRLAQATDRYLANAEMSREFLYTGWLQKDMVARGEDYLPLQLAMEELHQREEKNLKREILSYESQKSYHKAYRSLIKGLRASEEPLFRTAQEGLQIVRERREELYHECLRSIELLNATETDDVLTLIQQWRAYRMGGEFVKRFFGALASEEHPDAGEIATDACIEKLADKQELLRNFRRIRNQKQMQEQPALQALSERYEAQLIREIQALGEQLVVAKDEVTHTEQA